MAVGSIVTKNSMDTLHHNGLKTRTACKVPLLTNAHVQAHMKQGNKIKLGQGNVYNCIASPLLSTTAYKHLGTEEKSCWTFGSLILEFCLVFFVIFCISSNSDVFGWRKVWTANRPVQHFYHKAMHM